MQLSAERILLLLMSATQAVWMVSWIIGRWTQRQEISNVELGKRITVLESRPDATLMDRDIKTAHLRMDQAGRQMSDLATDIQGIDQRMRMIFVSKELAEEWLRESREDRRQLWESIETLRRRGNR